MVIISAIPRVRGPAETLGSSFKACRVVGIASPIKQAAVKVKTKINDKWKFSKTTIPVAIL